MSHFSPHNNTIHIKTHNMSAASLADQHLQSLRAIIRNHAASTSRNSVPRRTGSEPMFASSKILRAQEQPQHIRRDPTMVPAISPKQRLVSTRHQHHHKHSISDLQQPQDEVYVINRQPTRHSSLPAIPQWRTTPPKTAPPSMNASERPVFSAALEIVFRRPAKPKTILRKPDNNSRGRKKCVRWRDGIDDQGNNYTFISAKERLFYTGALCTVHIPDESYYPRPARVATYPRYRHMTRLSLGWFIEHKRLPDQMRRALQLKSKGLLRFCVLHGADVNWPLTEAGETAVHIAARSAWKEGIHYLVYHNAGWEVTDRKGRTALVHAVDSNDAECVRFLLWCKADYQKWRSDRGLTLKEYAREKRLGNALNALVDAEEEANKPEKQQQEDKDDEGSEPEECFMEE